MSVILRRQNDDNGICNGSDIRGSLRFIESQVLKHNCILCFISKHDSSLVCFMMNSLESCLRFTVMC